MLRLGGKIEEMITPSRCEDVTLRYCAEHKKRRAVRRILNDVAGFVADLHGEMISGHYKPGIYRPRHIGGNGEKERDILVPTVRDAIAAGVIVNIVSDFAGRRLYPHTYCNRIGYGGALLAKRLRSYLVHEKPTYYVKFDIRKCFDSLRHEDAEAYIDDVIKCAPLAELTKVLAIPQVCRDKGVGIPIGNGLSHHLANGILSEIWFAARRLKGVDGLWSYMDDAVFVGNNKRKLMRAAKDIEQMLAAKGLQYKYAPQVNRCTEGIDIVGYRFWPDGRTRMRRKNFRRARRSIVSASWKRAAAYFGMAKVAHDKALFNALRGAIKKGVSNESREQ